MSGIELIIQTKTQIHKYIVKVLINLKFSVKLTQMEKSCAMCKSAFRVPEEDLKFYDMISPVFGEKKHPIPPPTLCPDCRCQRRLAWRNEKRLYHRKCDYSGKEILSIYSPDKPFKVFEQDIWHSDVWDPLTFGRDFDFSRPFFEQWNELHHAVPLPSMNLRFQNENSDYTNLSARNKNCYLIFASNDNEDCYYCTFLHRSHNMMDCYFTFDSESCYECVDCYDSNNLFFSQYCKNCFDSVLLYSCQGCSNCLGCVNLVNKQYHILNQPVSKEDFQRQYDSAIHHRAGFADILKQREALRLTLPHKYMAGFGSENCTGDHLSYSRNVKDSYDITYSEDCRYCVWFHKAKNCYDCYGWALPGELGLENHLLGNTFYNVAFSESCANNVSNLLYCRYCENGCKDLFGCIGLQHKQYCVFNKQYSKEEYEQLVPKIIEHMRTPLRSPSGSYAGQEWGEFFPHKLSPYGYNETVAQEYFPLKKEEVMARKWGWRDIEDELPKADRVIDADVLPDSIDGVHDDVLNCAIRSEVTGKPFKIVKQELRLYRDLQLPLPRRCFDQRHLDRMALRNPRKLWNRECAKCRKSMATSFAPDRPEIVYCEECYVKEVF